MAQVWLKTALAAALAAAIVGVAVAQQTISSRAAGPGIEDPFTGAKHAGAKNWRAAPLRNGDTYMQRNTLLPPAQIACGFMSSMVVANGGQNQACAGLPNARPLAMAAAGDGRTGEMCMSAANTRTGYSLAYTAKFSPGNGRDTFVTCAVLADGMQLNPFNLSQHEKEVRSFLAGVSIPATLPAGPAPVPQNASNKKSGAGANGAGPLIGLMEDGYAQACQEGGGRAQVIMQNVPRVDVTGDGVPEWIAFGSEPFECVGGPPLASFFGGTGGSAFAVYDGTNAAPRAAPIFAQYVFGLQVIKVGERDVVEVDVGGVYCGAPGTRVTCQRHLAIDARTRKVVLVAPGQALTTNAPPPAKAAPMPAAAPRVTTTPCMEVYELEDRFPLRTVYAERGASTSLLATPGSATCTGALLVNGRATGSVTCQVRGPAFLKWQAPQDYLVFQVNAGTSATVVEYGAERRDTRNGNITCFENAR